MSMRTQTEELKELIPQLPDGWVKDALRMFHDLGEEWLSSEGGGLVEEARDNDKQARAYEHDGEALWASGYYSAAADLYARAAGVFAGLPGEEQRVGAAARAAEAAEADAARCTLAFYRFGRPAAAPPAGDASRAGARR